MKKTILVISTSPRKNGNSETLADAFMKGAADAGNQVEKISLYDKKVGFCKGCLACQKTQRCVIRDDADVIAQKNAHSGCTGICDADLLLRDVRANENDVGSRQSAILCRLRFSRCLYAFHCR